MEVDWLQLVRGEASVAEAGQLLSRTAERLKVLLEAQPQTEQRILSIFAKRLERPVDGKTWEVLDSSLATYLGREVAHLVMWAIDPAAGGRIEELEVRAPSTVMDVLRTIASLYGPELVDASEIAGRPADEWRAVSREIFYDQLAERHLLTIRIQKFNGEEFTITGSAGSLLSLTAFMIRSVRLVGTREGFDEESITLFLDESSQLESLLQPASVASSVGT